MKPDDIPQDVWDRAKDAVFDFDCDWTADGRRRGEQQEQDAIWLVARAILAERERIEALLRDPAAVRVNYLRGGIACQNLIDEAVAAERERCAKVAEKHASPGQMWERDEMPTAKLAAGYAARDIAAAIRKGGE